MEEELWSNRTHTTAQDILNSPWNIQTSKAVIMAKMLGEKKSSIHFARLEFIILIQTPFIPILKIHTMQVQYKIKKKLHSFL